MSMHKSLAIVVLMEGIANVVLSIVLVRPLGIVGDAIGTAIPLLCTSLFFLPRHLCRRLEVPLGTFVSVVYLWPFVLCLPMVFALALMQHFHYAHHYPELILNLLVGGVVYGVGVSWLFLTREPMGIEMRGKLVRYFAKAAER
jgi:uncharacterized membrane-anchored protein YitT (DUF2179 family)